MIGDKKTNIIKLVVYSNKISLQISLEWDLSNSSYIFILTVNFENLIVGLHVLILLFMFAKFQENHKSIAMSSNKY